MQARWVQRIDFYTVFYDWYLSIIKEMESISVWGSEHGECSCDPETLKKARGFLHQLVSFEFLVTFNVVMKVLSSFNSLTVNLQKKSNDIVTAYEYVLDVQLKLELLKTNCEEEFHT